MNKSKLVIFDIDGTLTDSLEQHEIAFVYAMQKLGFQKIDTNWSAYKHHTDSFILNENFEANFGRSITANEIDQFEEIMTDKILELSQVGEIFGAASFVEYLWKNTEYAVSFATGSLIKPAIIKLNEAGIPFEKELVVGSNHLESREEIVVKAIEASSDYFGCENFLSITSIGDGLWDLNTANYLNLAFIGIGETNAPKLKENGAKVVLNDFLKEGIQVAG